MLEADHNGRSVPFSMALCDPDTTSRFDAPSSLAVSKVGARITYFGVVW